VLSVEPVTLPTQAQFDPISINNLSGKDNIFSSGESYHFLNKHSDYSRLALLKSHTCYSEQPHCTPEVKDGTRFPHVLFSFLEPGIMIFRSESSQHSLELLKSSHLLGTNGIEILILDIL
jgi:hypothetical protein